MTLKEVDNEVIVFDGGCVDNPPILPPDGVFWQSIPPSKLHIFDDINPDIGLTLARSDNALPFFRLPSAISLKIIGASGLNKIYSALEACERLRKTSLVRSDKKRIFGDYGHLVRSTCAGVQVARRSKEVLNNAPYMDKLPRHHLTR